MSINYKNKYYNHFEKEETKTPPKFQKEKNYMMRFNTPLPSYKFNNNNLTIIYFKNGVGELKLKSKNVKIKANKFIITNPSIGWEYINPKEEYIDVLSLVISDVFREQFNYFVETTQNQLLDNPFLGKDNKTHFIEQTFGADYYRSGQLLQSIHHSTGDKEFSYTCPEEISIEVLQTIYLDQHKAYNLASHIKAKKNSTKLETLKRLLCANEYIHDNLMKPISLDELSKISTLSKYHLYNSFKIIYGKTPHQYINRLKIVKAKETLQKKNISITEISDTFGFSDSSVFGKVFKKMYGKPPSFFAMKHRLIDERVS